MTKAQVIIQPGWRQLAFQDLLRHVRNQGIGLENGRKWSNANDYKGVGGIRYQTLLNLSDHRHAPEEKVIRRVTRNLAGLYTLIGKTEPNADDWVDLIQKAFLNLCDDIGVGKSDYKFGVLLQKFRSAKGKKVGLFGATYVDVTISPITATNLSRDVSYSDLDAPKVTLGGGVVIFGREYRRQTGQTCRLHTVVGDTGDSFEPTHKGLLAEQSAWLEAVTEVKGDGGTPVAFHLHNQDNRSRSVFAHSAPSRAMAQVDVPAAVRQHDYGLIFTSYPECIQAKLKVPCVASYGYQSPSGTAANDSQKRKNALLSGRIDLLLGSFYEFARLWAKEPPRAKKWDRATRRDTLKSCFDGMRGDTVAIVRDFNYGTDVAQLNIFLVAGGAVFDLTSRLPKHKASDDGFFMDARRFDATLVALMVNGQADGKTTPQEFCNLINLACETAFPP